MTWEEYKKKRKENNASTNISTNNNSTTSSWEEYKRKRNESKVKVSSNDSSEVGSLEKSKQEKSNTNIDSSSNKLPTAKTNKLDSNTLAKIKNSNLSASQQKQVIEAMSNANSENSTIANSKQIIQDLEKQGGKLKKANTKKTDNLFNTGGFHDGYQIGDVSRTILGTASDIGMNTIEGIVGIGEGIGDFASSGIAQVADWTGNDEYANRVRNNIANKKGHIISKGLNNAEKAVDEYSIVGDKGDEVVSGIGQTAGYMALNAIPVVGPVASTAAMFGSAAGNSMSETYANGGANWQAWTRGIGSGLIETIVEKSLGFFGNSGGIDKTIANGISNRISSGFGKVLARSSINATAESVEEAMSYIGNQGLDWALDKYRKATGSKGIDLKENWDWEAIGEQMGTSFLSSLLTGGVMDATKVSNIKRTNNMTTREAINEYARQQDVQAQSEVLTSEINKLNKRLPKASDVSQAQELQNELNWKNKQLNALNKAPNIAETQNEINSPETIANKQETLYNNKESEVGINGERTTIQGNQGVSGQYDTNLQQESEQQEIKKYTRTEFEQWERSIKPTTYGKLSNEQKQVKNDIKRQYGKDIVFFNENNSKYNGGASLTNPNNIYVNENEVNEFGLNRVVLHEVLESNIAHNKELKEDIIIPTIIAIQQDPNFQEQKNKFWENQAGEIPSDYAIAKDIICDRFAEIKSGEALDYDIVLSQETNMTIDFAIENFETQLKNNKAPSLQSNVAERARKTDKQNKIKENEEIAKILDEPVTKEKEKSRFFAIAKANLIDKGIVFEELSRKAGNNRELQGKWDYTLTAEARGQNAIGNARYERDSKTKTEKQICKSLEDIRKEVGNKTHDFQEYMYHQLNIDRMTLEERFAGDTGTNYERKDVIKNKPVFGKSVTAEISRKIVAQYEKSNPEFKNWAQDVYDFLDANKKELVDRGVISQELSDKLAELYPHYVPIKRINAKGMAIKVPLDTNRTGINSPIAKATGGNSDIQPLFQTIADRTMQTYRASARNNFGVELMNTLNSVTETSKTDVDTILEEIGDTEANEELLKEGKNGNNPTFTVFNKGQKVTFEITKDMYDALKPQSEIIKNINNSKVSKVLNKISNFRRGVLTEYNPIFALINPIKDVQDVVVNSQHPAKTYVKIPEAYAQIKKKGYWYNEYVQNGGAQNSYFKDGEFTSDKKTTRLKTAVKIPFEKISNMNSMIEMTPRLAEYIASREAGVSIETAMLDASRVTTNFKAGGDFTKMLNRNGVTFLNASVQGMQQQIRNIQEANAKGLKGYAVLVTKYAIAGLPVVLLNGLIWKDDEDYEELQDYVKDNYYVIAKYGDGKFVRIPKGRVSATIQKIVGNATEYITDDKELNIENIGKDFWEDLKFARDNLAPNSPINNNILSPIKQVMTNTSWYGEDIVPSRLKDKPAKEQYDESIDSFSIKLGGILGISPYKINYLLDQYGGGVSDIVLPMMTKQAENNMFADKFTTDSVMKSKYPGEFYTSLDELKVKANSSKATDEDILKYKYISSISSEMSELYNQKREIQNSNATDKEKKERLKVVQKKINEVAKEAVGNNSKIKISGNTATISDTQYYKVPSLSDGTMKWNKVSDEEKEKNKNISLRAYADYKNKIANETIRQRKIGSISSEGQLKNKDKMQIVLKSTYTNKEKSAIYENYIKEKDDQKYDIIKSSYTTIDKLNIDKYLQYKLAEANGEFDSDKKDDGTVKGKSVYGSAKEKRWDYIENMNITYTQKLILWGLEYTPSDYEQKQIVTYIKALPNKTPKEKLEMLSYFKGFKIYKNGNFKY